MGDGADAALEAMWDDDEFQLQHLNDLPGDLPDGEWEELYDENGVRYPPVMSGFGRPIKASYAQNQNCPNCGTPLIVRDGPHGRFAGCPRFPECRGNRNLI